MSQPSVSCLMVTANRPFLAGRAIACFASQTWSNKELIIVDDGEVDYTPLIEISPVAEMITYHRLRRGTRATLGELRNLSMELSSGDWLVQWDDDDWYHPDRISTQVARAIAVGAGASALRWTLTSVSAPGGGHLDFRSDAGIATPGTIVYRAGGYRYPHLPRNEDGVFMRRVREEAGLAVLGRESSHLFVRVHHGSNTWDREHFLGKLHRTPLGWPAWIWARYIRRDIATMGRFDLDERESATLRAMRDWTPDPPTVESASVGGEVRT